MGLDSMYQEIILDHYRHPHGAGLRSPYDGEAHHVNPTCGDEVTMRVRLSAGPAGPDAAVEDVSYQALGCSISQASASVLRDLVVGRSVAEGMDRAAAFLELMGSRGQGEPDEQLLEDAVAFAGVSRYPARVKCALLPWMAWKEATTRSVADAGVRRPDLSTRSLAEAGVRRPDATSRPGADTGVGRPAAGAGPTLEELPS